jgi:serine phosphatase RsbU (regulator of sigma subunit)
MIRGRWGRVRWKMISIISFTATSAILVACLAVAGLNVMVRRESSNVVEKQIQMLVQTSRSVAPAMLDHAAIPGALKPLLAYTDEAFPRAQASLILEDRAGVRSLLSPPDSTGAKLPDWLPETGFAGLVVDRGQIEIRDVATQNDGACKVTAVFSMPLGSELAGRLSSAAGRDVTAVSPRPFRVHLASQRVLRTVERNFIPGMSEPTAVVLSVLNWETGAVEDWIAYSVRASYSSTFEDVARLGGQLAGWVWLFTGLVLTVVFLDASGVWMSIRLGSQISTAIDDLSSAARQIATGNFAWRTPVRTKGQLGDLMSDFNQMAIALERLQQEEAAKLRYESELQVARSVQEYLYPRTAPAVKGATISGRTLPARMIGGDLYDFFDLGQERIGILCADVSGKGIPAALMMANLQAVARALLGDGMNGLDFVELLNQRLTGRFGDNRYATLFWAEYDTKTAVLTYVNAGHPSPILIRSTSEIESLNSDGVPVGMFAKTEYVARNLEMHPGNRLIIFSDGLTDAQNASEQDFGESRLMDSCRSIPSDTDAKGVADRVMGAVTDWSVGTEQFDDMTIVVLDIPPSPEIR